jgi:Regulator of chromosome condensation (RCC1) repeat
VQGFGNNDNENTLGLGPDAFGDVHTPTNLLKIPATATKVSDMCAIVGGGDVWCWSDAEADKTNDLSIPARVEGLSNIVQVVGESTACALDTNGAVFCWGDGGAYEIGDGEFHGDSVVTPAAVLSLP